MEVFSIILLFTLIAICFLITAELFAPRGIEAFTGSSGSSFWASFVTPRSDIDPTREDPSYIRDPRYFNDYADVSRIGTSSDFCRMVALNTDPTNLFFACALAGTEHLDSTKFRTPGTKDGFRISYDDYMRDINGDGRSDYCRILRMSDGSYQPVCSYAGDMGFDGTEKVDSKPPSEITRLLEFYDGCVMWLRFKGDMLDTVNTVNLSITGNLLIDETPRRKSTEGLQFNGSNQFIRLSDSPSLSLGYKLPIRSIRSWMVWVYFDEFTNNAKIFDFGNGSGKDNVFLGILGTGDSGTQSNEIRPHSSSDDCPAPEERKNRSKEIFRPSNLEESTVPTGKSGAQPAPEMSPQRLMETTDANLDEQGEYMCTSPNDMTSPSITEGFADSTSSNPVAPPSLATLLYEVWDKQARKMRIKVSSAIPLKKWTHITITTTTNDAFRPNIAVYIDGKKILEKESGWLPAASTLTNCYIGKSNWSSTGQYDNRDDLFKGKLFDMRAYKTSLAKRKIADSFAWGKEQLLIR